MIRAFIPAVLGIASLAGCTEDGAERSTDGREAGARRPRAGGEVVSVVGDRTITTGDVARAARRTGLSPERALERLQAQELLGREARRRGYADRAEVRRVRRQAMVQALLQREVEDPATVDDEAVRERFEEKPGAGVSFAEAEGDIRQALLTERRRKRLKNLLASLRERYSVRHHPDRIRRTTRMEGLVGGDRGNQR